MDFGLATFKSVFFLLLCNFSCEHDIMAGYTAYSVSIACRSWMLSAAALRRQPPSLPHPQQQRQNQQMQWRGVQREIRRPLCGTKLSLTWNCRVWRPRRTLSSKSGKRTPGHKRHCLVLPRRPRPRENPRHPLPPRLHLRWEANSLLLHSSPCSR